MSDKKVIFSMVGVAKSFPPNRDVIKDISLSYYYGAKIGVLGLNGSGKSTLLRIMARQEQDHAGEVHLTPDISIEYLPQEPMLNEKSTVKQSVSEGVQEVVDLLEEFEQINAKFGEPLSDDEMNKLIDKQARVQDQLDRLDAWDLESKLEYAMEALNCPQPDQLISSLSGGERRRVALCRILLREPDILLLDEPTNHLDADTVGWLERHLKDYKGTVIAVTHDRYFLDNVAGWILELDRGKGVPWKGNYSSWLEQKKARLDKEEKADDRRQQTLQRELDWIRMSPKARQAKSKARINAYENLLKQDVDKMAKDLQIFVPSGPRLGDVVIKAKNLTKAYGERVIFKDLNFELPPGGIVGVVGPNGAGKTTLFKLITGEEKPTAGEILIGETVKLSYMEQSRSVLKDEQTVWEAVSGGSDIITIDKHDLNSRAYIARFNFSGSDQQKQIGDLSGGERNRIQMALMLKEGANVLLLDEPTNDLDVNTLRALEQGLESFAGCAVIISHDRWFLDRVATHILSFESDQTATWFEGNYSDYEQDMITRLGKNAPSKKVRFQKLKR